MNVSFQIARRYLFGKKSTNAINIITGISALGIAIGTTALILIMSVFNGFEMLTTSNLDHYNPDYKITANEGKFFQVGQESIRKLENLPGVMAVSKVIEEVAHFEYNSKQQIGIMKGVDTQFTEVTDLDNALREGEVLLRSNANQYFAVIGNGIYNSLNISLSSKIESLRISVPNRRKRGAMDRDFKSRGLLVSGVFSIKNEKDYRYIIIDYDLACGLLDLKGQVSAIELKVDSSFSAGAIVKALGEIYPEDTYTIADRLTQEASILKIMNIEKWSSFLIFSFTLILIIFNVIGCLWMIVLEKRKDLSVLQSYGATKKMIKQIFLLEGAMISIVGFLVGLVFSVLFYLLQKNVGIITVPDGFSITNYPMEMHGFDVFIVMLTVLTLGIIASIPAAYRASQVSAYVRME